MASRATLSIAVVAVGGLIAAMPIGGAVAASSHQSSAHQSTASLDRRAAARLGRGGRSIVVLRDQRFPSEFRGMSVAGSSAVTARAEERGVAASIRIDGGTVRSSYRLINAIAATLTPAAAHRLAADPAVARIVPDARIQAPAAPVAPAGFSKAKPAGNPGDIDDTSGVAPPANTCPSDPSDVQLEPEALETTKADSDQPGAKTARSLGYDGSGVTVAFMAEGIDINNPDFMRNGHTIFSDYKDFSGDGPNAPTSGDEAFLDASAIGAQGNETYNIQHFSSLGLTQKCLIRVEGEAPGVNLVGLKVFSNGYSTTSGFLDAIQYAVEKDHVNVLSQSFGSNPIPDTAQDVIRAADEAAVRAGTTVTVSSGDAGITNTIGSPATDPSVISVGASTTYRFDLQTGYASARFPGITGWLDDNISSLSSGGFDTAGRTVTMVAPGELNYAVCSKDLTMYDGCADFKDKAIGLEDSGGTSEAAPTVAGVAAMVIQAYRDGHNGASPTPAVVKEILTSSADDIDAPAVQQGAGMVNAYKAVLLAKSFGPKGTPTGNEIASKASEFSAIASPSTHEKFTDSITNEGTSKQTVSLSSRTLGAYKTIKSATVLLAGGSSPKYVDFQGLSDNYETVNFTVPAGESRLETSIAYKASSLDLASRDRMTLVDPNGDLAGYSLPQGIGNFGHVEVADPVAGTWTAIIASRIAAYGGSTGQVKFGAAVAKYKPFGTVSPKSLTLAPGKTGKVTLSVATGSSPGDSDGSLVISTSPNDSGPATVLGSPETVDDQAATTVPVTLRSEIPAGRHTFSQILTGGNGRDEFPGDQYFYAIDVKRGAKELNASVKLKGHNDPFQAALVSPQGNMTAFASNYQMTTSPLEGQETKPTDGLQLHSLNPQPGRWEMLVDFTPVVAGNALSTPFSVSVDEDAVRAHASGLPDSRKAVVKKGKSHLATVYVRNTGKTPEAYFVDPRADKQAIYSLKAIAGSPTSAPIEESAAIYVVPSDTTSLAAVASTSGPKAIEFDAEGPLGDPDIESSSGKSVGAAYQASPVAPGAWDIAPAQLGPYASAATPELVKPAMVAKTRAFDRSVKPSTGDLWQVALSPNLTFNAVTVEPGHTAAITVRLHGTGAGLHHGTLFIDDADLVETTSSAFISPDANQVAALPYEYRVAKH